METFKKHKYIYIFLILIALYIIGRFFLSIGNHEKQNEITVVVSSVIEKDVLIYTQTLGTVQPYSTVNINSLVTGQLIKMGFQEGDVVNKDQELFFIDQRPFMATLNQAKADLLRNQAILSDYELQVKRNTPLLKKGYVSAQAYDTLLANQKSAEAAVSAAAATVENAELQLSYTTIRAPIAGKTGNATFQPGSVIKANETMLVTINQINPIYVVFSLPQNKLFAVLDRYNAKQIIPVKATISEGQVESGEVSFIDNAINPATGTVEIKATFANKDHRLWPGQYVNVELPIERVQHGLLIPSLAILTGQSGFYVYVVDEKSMVQMRVVVPGDIVHGQTLIRKGLKVGEKVVISGQLKLQNGMKVKIVENGSSVKDATPK